jgi:hypothetical protein
MGEQPKRLSAQELRSALAFEQSKIKNVYLDYWGDDAYRDDDSFPPGTYLRRIVAAQQPNLFSHETAHGTDALPWEEDPRRRHCIVENDRAFDYWVTNRAYNKTAVWKPDAPLPGSMPDEPILLSTGIWPLTGRPGPTRDGRPLMLRDVSASDRYVIRPELELVDGHWCHVLEEPSVDCLWIDVERGCAMTARELYDTTTGAVRTRYELKEHREVVSGVWLPTLIRMIQYDSTATEPESKSRVVKDLQLHISTARVNAPLDSMFVFDPEPGALWLNPPSETSRVPVQTHSGGIDHLDNVVAWAKRNLPAPDKSGRSWSSWLIAGIAGLGVVLIAEAFHQRK